MEDGDAAKEKIEQCCQRVKANLNKCTLADTKKALNSLDVQVVVIPEKMKNRTAFALEFITIERTSA